MKTADQYNENGMASAYADAIYAVLAKSEKKLASDAAIELYADKNVSCKDTVYCVGANLPKNLKIFNVKKRKTGLIKRSNEYYVATSAFAQDVVKQVCDHAKADGLDLTVRCKVDENGWGSGTESEVQYFNYPEFSYKSGKPGFCSIVLTADGAGNA